MLLGPSTFHPRWNDTGPVRLGEDDQQNDDEDEGSDSDVHVLSFVGRWLHIYPAGRQP
jgi:hypothetical protein